MPLNDYTDPEAGLKFPRLQVRIHELEGGVCWVQVWLREELGEKRDVLMNQKIGGSWRDAYDLVWKFAEQKKALVEPDDFEVIHRDEP
jgi:hypothetical protein